MSFDVLTLGEAMLRLSVGAGERLEEADRLYLHVAGAEANTAIALAQVGRSVTWFSRLPEGPLGRRVERDLRANGVDTTHVQWVPGKRMGLYFVELAQPPRQVGVLYDRADSAAAGMGPRDLPAELLDSARLVHLTGITPALSESCRRLCLEVAERARQGEALLTVDVNYRARLWSPQAARECMTELGTGADLVVVTREDARDVFQVTGEPAEAAAELLERFDAGNVVLTLGEEGSVWVSERGPVLVEGIPTVVVDRLGAGDAFMAGLIDGILDGDLERGTRFGTVLASLALGTRGDHVTTTRSEVESMLAGRDRAVDR